MPTYLSVFLSSHPPSHPSTQHSIYPPTCLSIYLTHRPSIPQISKSHISYNAGKWVHKRTCDEGLAEVTPDPIPINIDPKSLQQVLKSRYLLWRSLARELYIVLRNAWAQALVFWFGGASEIRAPITGVLCAKPKTQPSSIYYSILEPTISYYNRHVIYQQRP